MDDRPVAIVTGTSRGIGRGIAQHLLEQGFHVAGCSRGAATIVEDRYRHAQLDVADEAAVQQWIRSIKTQHDRIEGLVCNAGHVRAALLMSLTSGNILETFLGAHVRGTFFVCREVAKAMTSQRYGRIVTMSSIAVPIHLEGASAYVASKGAVVEMTKVLARELAPAGITCNAVAPGLVETDQAEKLGETWKRWFLDQQTIKRPQTIHEVCHVVDFLLHPASAAVTGQVINLGLVT
jgi:3-oxoacyl-[acyl-carrier protein] reductase